jgi:hypothetical protein
MLTFPQLAPGERYALQSGVFDYEQLRVMFPSGRPDKKVWLQGAGMGRTILKGSRIQNDVPQFCLGNTILSDMTVMQPMRPKDDCSTIGFPAQSAGSTPFSATLLRCELIGAGWVFYYWADDPTAAPPTLTVRDCLIKHGRIGIACGNSANGMNLTVERTTFIGNAIWSWYGGTVSDPTWGGVVGILVRGGSAKINDCAMYLTGCGNDPADNVWVPRLIGVSDNIGDKGQLFEPAGNTRIEIDGLRTVLDAMGSTFVYDVDATLVKPENLVVRAGYGSATNGGLTYSTGPAGR